MATCEQLRAQLQILEDDLPGARTDNQRLKILSEITAVHQQMANQGCAQIGGGHNGGKQHDPYDDILATCQKLNAMKPVVVEPIPLQTVLLGVIDAGSFSWDSKLPNKTHTVTFWEPPDPASGSLKPHKVTETVTEYYFNAQAVLIQLVVNLINNSSEVVFTVGDQVAVAQPGSTSVALQGPFSGDVNFVITTESGAGELTVRVDRSGLVDHKESIQAGCVVVPAFPIAVVYQPPTANGRGVFDSTQSIGASVTHVSASPIDSSATPSTMTAINTAILVLQGIASGANLGGEYGAAINSVASFLAALLQSFTSDPPSVVTMTYNSTTNTLESLFTSENTYYSSDKLGPGPGDVIVYLQDATFAFYNINGNATLVPLGFRGPAPLAVPAASLMPGATQPADLPDGVRAALLALDPVASGHPEGVTNTDRYSYLGEFVQLFEIQEDHCFSSTKSTSTIKQLEFDVINANGELIGIFYGGESTGTSQTNTYKTCVQITGPFDFEVWFDHHFGTFAYRDLLHMHTSSSISYEGTLLHDNKFPLVGQLVTLVQNNHRVNTITDDQGRYQFRSPSLKAGSAELLLPSSSVNPRRQKITLHQQKSDRSHGRKPPKHGTRR